MKLFSALLFALLPLCASAANHYIRDGGSGDGSAWNSALDDLPSTLTRGDTYYIADGTYAAYTFNDSESGTSVITVKKATVADHGTSTGWSDAYGDGEAVFTSGGTTWTFANGYYTINGQVGSGTSGYGIRVTSTASRAATQELTAFTGSIGSTVLNDILLSYIDFDWDNGTGTSSSGVTRAFDNAIITSDGMTFSHCYVHDSSGFAFGFFYGNTTDLTIEYCVFDNNGGGGGEAAHWELFWFTQVTDLTFRWNIVRDVIGQQGQTGWLMVGDCTNVYIYGNVFYNTSGSAWTGNNGTIATWSNDEFANTNVYIYNNTFVDLPVSTSEPSINFTHNSADDTNVVAKNNLFYNSVFNYAGIDTATYNAFGGGQGSTGSNTQTGLSSSIFTSYASQNFTLASNTTAGEDLGSPYNVDMLGNARTTWSRGAYEFVDEDQVATPTFDPVAGSYGSTQNVTIATVTSGATIHYTVDGSDPTTGSATYSTPISVSVTTTVKALAVKAAMTDSTIASATYTISGGPVAGATVTNTTTVTGTLNFPGGGGGGGPAEVASISTNGGINGVTSGSIDTTGANLLIASVAWYPAAGADVTTAEFSDSKGNTWTQLNLAGVISSTLSANRLFWCVPSSVGSGHTFTVTETGSYASISVLALSGMSGAPFDQQAQNEQSATTTLQPGSITASQANAVLVTGLAFEASGTISINSSFEEPVTTNYSAGNGLGSSISWRIDTSATATNPTWTTTGSTSLAASMASFEY